MHAELHAQLAFRLTGTRDKPASFTAPEVYRPALAARHHDLSALRYDFPLVLLHDGATGGPAMPLAAIVDVLLGKMAASGEGEAERLRPWILKVEREMRSLLAEGATRSLQRLWSLAVGRAAAPAQAGRVAAAIRAAESFAADGDVIDCDEAFPRQLILHAWKAEGRRKSARYHDEAERLTFALGDILAADDVRSQQGRSAERLRNAMGNIDRETFDFEAMSQMLARVSGKSGLTESRRRRVRSLIAHLESQRVFHPSTEEAWIFERCGTALEAFRGRYSALRSLARTLAVARLEAEGLFDERRHGAFFERIADTPLAREELAQFPAGLVCLRQRDLDRAGRGELLELLASGAPVKVLVQWDDVLQDACCAQGLGNISAGADAIAGAALGLGDVFVVQASAAALPSLKDAVVKGLAHAGPTLFNVFSGAVGASSRLPAYLNAAAATESRAFPTFTFDPAQAAQGEVGLSLEGNPQPDRDWPVHGFDYEDREMQRVHEELAFTIADYLAADERFVRHFLSAPAGTGKRVPVAEWLANPSNDDADAPVAAVVDGENRLHHIVVDEAALELARRGLDRWRTLKRRVAPPVVLAPPAAAVETPVAEAAPVAPAAAPAPAPAAEAAPAPSGDDAYIETARCTTCNECTTINNKMFAYNDNKQAFIKDPDAGTYRQLVEAAESCQISIIHPGKPRNPDEPGLAELLERAQPFL